MITKAARVLLFVNQLDQLLTDLKIFFILCAQIHLLCFRYHLREGIRPFRMYVKNHGVRGRSKTRGALKKHFVSHMELLLPLLPAILFNDRIFSRSCFHLARGDRAIAIIFEFRVFDASWRRRASKRFELSRDARSILKRGAGSIGRIDERIPGGRSIVRERKAWVRNAVVYTRHCRLYPQLCRYSASALRCRGGRSCATVCDFVHVHPHNHVTRGRVAARGETGWTGRDGEKDRNEHVESAEVRQKRRDSDKETERDGRIEKRRRAGVEVVRGGETGSVYMFTRDREEQRERMLCTGRQETRASEDEDAV